MYKYTLTDRRAGSHTILASSPLSMEVVLTRTTVDPVVKSVLRSHLASGSQLKLTVVPSTQMHLA